MDLVLLAKVALMGVVEGLTEFLPISSTGHLILTGSLLGMGGDKFKTFEMVIQMGAILAVILIYWQKIRSTIVELPTQAKARAFTLNVIIAFFPAVLLGLMGGKAVKAHLFTPMVVASAFIVGGLVILWAERRQRLNPALARVQEVEHMTAMDALKVGLVQCLAFIPGTSRSGATIIGGMLVGLSRKAATEFSFYLAIPTLIGAGCYSLYKERASLAVADLPVFAVGTFVSFVFAWICIRWLLRYIATHSFEVFAWYRIAFGLLVLATAWGGLVNWAE